MHVAIVWNMYSAPTRDQPPRVLGWAGPSAPASCASVVSATCPALRWYPGYFEDDHGTHLRFFFQKRKSGGQYSGHWVNIAAADPATVAPGFSTVTESRRARGASGGSDPALRRIWRRVGGPAVLAPPFFEQPPNAVRAQFMVHTDFAPGLRSALALHSVLVPR